jgi:hypothetical protein
MNWPDEPVMQTLAALIAGGTDDLVFFTNADGTGRLGVTLAPKRYHEIDLGHLAELQSRKWVEVSDEDLPGESIPESVTVTLDGRYWLERYCKVKKIVFTFTVK